MSNNQKESAPFFVHVYKILKNRKRRTCKAVTSYFATNTNRFRTSLLSNLLFFI